MNIPKAQSALTPKSELPWSSKDAIIRSVLYYLLILVFLVTFQLGLIDLIFRINQSIDPLIIEAAVNGIIGFALTFIFLIFDGKKLSSVGFKLHKKFPFLIIVAFFCTVISLLSAYLIEMVGSVVSLDQMLQERYMIEDLTKITELLNYLIIVIITFFGIALGEEIMFRGYLQNVIESQTTYIKATAVTSILFGFLHSFLLVNGQTDVLQTMIAVGVSATIFGFVFSYAYKVSGRNLTLPILIHGIWNSIIFFFKTSFDYKTVSQISFEIFSQFIAAIILILLLFAFSKYFELTKE